MHYLANSYIFVFGDPHFQTTDNIYTNPAKEDHVQKVLDKIVELFKTGNVPEMVAYATFPPPNIPMARWSICNRILCFIQDTDDARGYAQWKEVNRHVKKGAKAIHILRPRIVKDKDKTTGDEIHKLIGFVAQPVFRIEDTEGEPVTYERYDLPNKSLLIAAQKLGINVKTSFFPGNYFGYYRPDTKAIRLASSEESVFLHELAHAADHKLHGYLKGGQDPIQEIVAELSAACLTRLVGLEPERTLGNNYTYIKSYALKMYKDSGPNEAVAKACHKVLSRVAGVIGLILDALGFEAPSGTDE